MAAAATLAETLQRAADALQRAGISQPRFEAGLLLSLALKVGREWVLAHPEFRLDAAQQSRLESLLRRRVAREPMAYIRGDQEFFGRRFEISGAVLIPRPETELLVEVALQAIDRAAERGVERPVVVDVGTGSGVIALTLALERPHALVVAIDVDPQALAIAERNAMLLSASARFLCADLLSPVRGPVDLLVANLPYVPEARWAALQPELHYEPRAAVLAGSDGLELIERLLRQAAERLAPGAEAALEMDEQQGERLSALATRMLPSGHTEVLRDHAGMDRVLHLRLP